MCRQPLYRPNPIILHTALAVASVLASRASSPMSITLTKHLLAHRLVDSMRIWRMGSQTEATTVTSHHTRVNEGLEMTTPVIGVLAAAWVNTNKKADVLDKSSPHFANSSQEGLRTRRMNTRADTLGVTRLNNDMVPWRYKYFDHAQNGRTELRQKSRFRMPTLMS